MTRGNGPASDAIQLVWSYETVRRALRVQYRANSLEEQTSPLLGVVGVLHGESGVRSQWNVATKRIGRLSAFR